MNKVGATKIIAPIERQKTKTKTNKKKHNIWQWENVHKAAIFDRISPKEPPERTLIFVTTIQTSILNSSPYHHKKLEDTAFIK